MKKVALMLVVCMLFLCVGCKDEAPVTPAKADGSYEANVSKISQMEQTGDSTHISGLRTGVGRTGMTYSIHSFECTDDGVYFLSMAPIKMEVDGIATVGNNATFLFFAAHDSDQVIKLCGRPDCTHDTVACNACFEHASSGVTYYNGHLYIAQENLFEGKYVFELYRVNLDGSNRLKVASLGDRAKYSGTMGLEIIDGVASYTLLKVDQETGIGVQDRFYYALDGSMREPVLAENQFSHMNQEGMDVRVTGNGDDWGYSIYSTDFRNDEWTFVFDASKYQNGYWGKEAGYVLLDDAITKVHYSDGREEVLFRTGLEGGYHPRFFPDCIVLTQTTDAAGNMPEVPMVYFYSWAGEFLGEVAIDFPYDYPTASLLLGGGESKDRIYVLSSQRAHALPQYYIDKSEFGTGQITLHKLEYPDFTENDYSLLFTVF